MLPNLLPVEDTEVSQALEKSFQKQGIKFLTEHEDDQDRGDRQRGEDHRGTMRRAPSKCSKADVCLVAIGVAPLLPGGNQKLELTRTRLSSRRTTATRRTCTGVFAAGDIIGPPWLAHVASYEAIQAVEGHVRSRLQAEESRRSSPAAPTASRRSPASASPNAPRRKRGSNSRSASSLSWPAAKPARSARAKAS